LILNEYYDYANNKVKTRVIPNTVKTEIINQTSFYLNNSKASFNTRCQFIINDITDVKKCLNCGNGIHPDRLSVYYSQNYCSNKCAALHENTREKFKNTCMEKYGVEFSFQSDEIKDKIKQTNIERYGVRIASRHKIIKEKKKQKNTERKTSILKQYDADELYRKRGPSYLESEMAAFLDSIGVTYEANNRTILGGKELDFYIPNFNIAIEMNGLYWHTDKIIANSKYHYNKWKACNDQGIHLVSVFEDDWNLQPEKIKSMLLTFFNKKPSGIAARKTIVKEIGANLARPFLEKYHLQGFVGGTHFGAFDCNNNLVAVMTFGYTRNQRFELKRFVMDNYNHPGMFSKIFKYAQTSMKFQEVVSFSDNTCFTGNVYRVNGFNHIRVIDPDYRYLINDKRIHKSNFKKNDIKKKFPELCEAIDNGMTETQAMDYLNIPKIYDCGKKEWIWKT